MSLKKFKRGFKRQSRCQLRMVRATLVAMTYMLAGGGADAAPGVPKINPTKKNLKSEFAPRVVTAMSTPLKSGHPLLFLNGVDGARTSAIDPLETRLQFPADQRYSKWSVIFDVPLQIDSVEVETCDGTKPFSDGVELFIDYNERRLYSDGGRKTVKFDVRSRGRALTLNFLESPGLCLDRIQLRTKQAWLRPRILRASGSAVIADGSIAAASRSRPEGKNAKYSDGRARGEWKLDWENPLIVESLRIWNGNQGPGETFTNSDRVREIEVRTDGEKPVKTTLEDRRFSQDIEIAEPKAIRSLALKSLATYPAATSSTSKLGDLSDPVLGEVQLSAGGETWLPVVPASANAGDDSRVSEQVSLIREQGYGDILDRELRVDERGEIWKFRFRSDGTFFARVFVDRARVAKSWSVTGLWKLAEVGSAPAVPSTKASLSAKTKSTPSAEAPRLAFSIVGTKLPTAHAVDSLPCGNQCFAGGEDRRPSAQRELAVFELIELQRERRSLFFIRNRTDQEKRTLEFGDLKVRIHSLYD